MEEKIVKLDWLCIFSLLLDNENIVWLHPLHNINRFQSKSSHFIIFYYWCKQNSTRQSFYPCTANLQTLKSHNSKASKTQSFTHTSPFSSTSSSATNRELEKCQIPIPTISFGKIPNTKIRSTREENCTILLLPKLRHGKALSYQGLSMKNQAKITGNSLNWATLQEAKVKTRAISKEDEWILFSRREGNLRPLVKYTMNSS